MNIGGIFLTAFCAIAASLISIHFFIDPEPEMRKLVSADGQFSLEGKVYEAQSLSLHQQQVEIVSPLLAPRYTLSPQETRFSEPILGSFSSSEGADQWYFFDERGFWIPLVQQEEGERVRVKVSSAGTYAPGKALSIEVPTFIDVVSALRSRVPEHAVSYVIRLIARPHQGAPILLSDAVERGGCGGLPTVSEQTVTTQEERTVQVLVNDVFSETTFTFYMEIGVTPNGCPEDMPLQVIL
jgi:hypothetical protein